MGHFGFSYVGLVFLLMLFIPNLIWAKNQPSGYDAKGENKVLLACERIGQVCVTVTALVFSDFNIHGWSWWNVWLIVAFLFMLLYECWWIRYFKSEKKLADFYSSFLGIPVIAFFLLGIYGKVIWMLLFVTVLGVGHIGIHLQHLKQIRKAK